MGSRNSQTCSGNSEELFVLVINLPWSVLTFLFLTRKKLVGIIVFQGFYYFRSVYAETNAFQTPRNLHTTGKCAMHYTRNNNYEITISKTRAKWVVIYWQFSPRRLCYLSKGVCGLGHWKWYGGVLLVFYSKLCYLYVKLWKVWALQVI